MFSSSLPQLALPERLLGVISNLAPLYTRGAAGDSILRAVSEIELLANAITANLMSKAETVRLIPVTT